MRNAKILCILVIGDSMEISWLDASDQVIKEIRNLDVYKRLEKLRKQLHKDKEVRAT